jgi:hypothetical protein
MGVLMGRRRKPGSMWALEDLGRVRLSPNFFFREFLYSDIANFYGIQNIPEDPNLAVEVGRKLCNELLEPLRASFGGLAIRSAYRAPAVNEFGNKNGLNCARNEANRAGHIWDQRDEKGRMGATACVVVPWFADRYAEGTDWRALAWWIHDHVPYHALQFFPKLCAFNITWREQPERVIASFIAPKGILTRPGMENHGGSHAEWYAGFPAPVAPHPSRPAGAGTSG